MGWPVARLLVLALTALACAPPSYARTLLIDQVPPYGSRAAAFQTLRAGGWCPVRAFPGTDAFRKCDGGMPMRLFLTFDQGELVHAVFVLVASQAREASGTPALTLSDRAGGEDGSKVKDGRATIEKVVPVVPPLLERVPPAQGDLSARLYAALGRELERRFGAPEVSDREAGIWRVHGSGRVELRVRYPFVVEIWAFAPWDLHRRPSPRELRLARPALGYGSPPVLERGDSGGEPTRACDAVHPCRPGEFCLRAGSQHICMEGADR